MTQPTAPTRPVRPTRRELLALAAASLLCASLPARARSLDEIRKSGTLVVASEGKFAPFNFVDAGKLAGFEIDIAEAVAKKMNLRIEWKTMSFDGLLVGLAQDRWDVVIASHGITAERARAVTFATPHYCTGGVIVSRDGALRTTRDLAGKVVAVQTGTTYYENVKKLPVKDVRNFPQDASARAALETGHVDAWVTDKFVARASLAATPGTTLKIGDFVFQERVAAAVALGNTALAGEIDKALAAMMADGTYAALSKKWFGEDSRCR
ncbi:MAG TPA: ABC transporter substrate-binding protein [Burkholderiaceae bacterium]|nr:ABC transporter substrate-binding protein [Burkholderiaceae bacterium]